MTVSRRHVAASRRGRLHDRACTARRRGLLLAASAWLAGACGGPAAPTFAADIAPLVYAHCAGCHRPGEPAPFSLLGYDDVFRKRKQIAEVTRRRLMPPWLPTHGDFAGDRRLLPAQIDLLARWVAAGAPRGDAQREPPPPQWPTGWQRRAPDLVLTAPAVPVPAAGPDRVRNFVLQVEAGPLRYVEAVEIRPDSRAVHHAVLAVDATRESRRLDALDPEPGFEGMVPGNARPPDGHFIGWTPGKRVQTEAPGMAWRLWPGRDLVLQLHLVPTGKPETVQARVGLWFTAVAASVETFPVALFSDRIDIAPGVADFALHDQCTLPVPVTVHSLYPHAHYRCRRMRAAAVLPDGGRRELFAIDDWDFAWQDDYRFREPVPLPAGTRLEMDYVYDNSDANARNPERPPQRVRFGQRSRDEMGTLTLLVSVADRPARLRLAVAMLQRDLEKHPEDPLLWAQLAGAQREAGDVAAAVAAARSALAQDPGCAPALLELGMAMELAGRAADAEQSYQDCLRSDPELALARVQLGGLLARSGRTSAAIEQYERALPLLPNLAALHNNLATACFASDRLPDAAAGYRRALALDPDYFNAWFNLGRVLARLGSHAEARAALERAQSLRPGDAAVAQALRELPR